MAALPNTRHETFARVYAVTHNTMRAMRVADPDNVDPSDAGNMMLRREDIAARILELSKRALQKADITAERVMLELARIAFADPRKMFDENGDLIPLHLLDDDDAATIAGYEVEEKIIGHGPGAIPIRTRKIKRVDKNPALLTLAKHFRIVGDEGDGLNAIAAALADRLRTARRRVIDSSEPVEDAVIVEPGGGGEVEQPQLEDERLW